MATAQAKAVLRVNQGLMTPGPSRWSPRAYGHGSRIPELDLGGAATHEHRHDPASAQPAAKVGRTQITTSAHAASGIRSFAWP